jgi:hypothetical protein
MRKGALLLLITAVLWSLGGLWVKFIDWNLVAIAGARSLIAFMVIAAVAASPWMFPVHKLEQNGLWLLMLGGCRWESPTCFTHGPSGK